MNGKEIIRPPAVAGMFYEKSPVELERRIGEMLGRVRLPEIKGNVKAVISPHAGYKYSGLTAAHVYKLIEGREYDCVITVGPSHQEYFDGISVYSGDAYETPLGEIPVNEDVRSELMEKEGSITASVVGHRREHSLEVQMPFLQYVLKKFSLVPIVMGNQQRHLCIRLSAALSKVMKDKNMLLVASSDLSHFHAYDEAVSMDKRVIKAVQEFDADAFIDGFENEQFEACGGGPIAVAMDTAKYIGARKVEILHYCNSGDITGDKSGVVGYLAAAFIRED
ncbi:MAG: AmmeMemoRadiSam system protein B [Bacteroidetes bacterium]|nr:AmmeMemoRadiSam system protein B [Bacteroidota bacterium]